MAGMLSQSMFLKALHQNGGECYRVINSNQSTKHTHKVHKSKTKKSNIHNSYPNNISTITYISIYF